MKAIFFCTIFVFLAASFCGCSAFESLTRATKDKTVAAGSDTWGGGGEASAATVETPVPSASFWFGRRKVWYVSVKDAGTGEAAADVVRASNSPLSVTAGPDGLTASDEPNPAGEPGNKTQE